MHEATTGQEALTWLRGGKPDLILLDMQLPGTGWLHAGRDAQGDAATRPIPLVAVTAFAMKGDAERVLAAGCDAYLAKPIDDAELLEVIERCLHTE